MDLPLVLPAAATPVAEAVMESPTAGQRREAATAGAMERSADLQEAARTREGGIQLPFGMSIDPDDNQFRRLTNGSRLQTRDLSPLQHDRMLEIAWYLWEQNGLAKRLITIMTDLILGEGITVTALDERVADQLTKTWAHPSNQLDQRIRLFYNFLSLTGELILPCVVNPVTGRPVFGFLDPYQVKRVIPDENNILLADMIELKPVNGIGEGQKLKVIRIDPVTDMLTGEVFYFRINGLPNSLRGRSDLGPIADWLDLFDQYLFAEVERLNLLSNFVWDYKIEDADEKKIAEKLAKFPNPKPGTVFAHNQKESLEARTPDLQAADRSEVARMLRVHIAGAMGMPASYLGETDSNKATIEGQNDIAMKTPAARQKEFMGFIELIVRFTIEQTIAKNRSLFRGVDPVFTVQMPEIAAKDVARVGQVLGQVASAMDTATNAGMLSKRVGTVAICAVLQHLGVNEDPKAVLEEAAAEAEERQAKADDIAQGIARASRLGPGANPPVEDPNADAIRTKQQQVQSDRAAA
jgi:hypothetical protein